jgi:hypothetical protein
MHALNSRFLAAVHRCSGQENTKQRLSLAWTEHLDAIAPEELPEILRGRFIELCNAMCARTPLAFESAAQASIRKMSAQEAADHIASIVAIYSEMAYTTAKTSAAVSANTESNVDHAAAENEANLLQLNS